MGINKTTALIGIALVVTVVALIAATLDRYSLTRDVGDRPDEPSTAAPPPTPTDAPAAKSNAVAAVPSPTPEPVIIAPYPDAPLCPDSGESHNNSLFHTLWDGVRGCHYDHEHGQYPFTPEVAATFPGFDLWTLLGSVGVGHTNPSSEMENTHKHGGFKWNVALSHSTGCEGRQGAATGVDAAVIQYHAFGDYSVEFESRIHSSVALMRLCREENPTDFGYIFVNQHQDYGQRTAPYQGAVLPYPDTPQPAYRAGITPYFYVECFGGPSPCDKYPTLQSLIAENRPVGSSWISEPFNLAESGSHLFALNFKVRDTYQALDWSDQEHPFTFRWLCSVDDGLTYHAPGCNYNNTTTQVQELAGEIPAAWDGLAGFDTDPRSGRVTAEGFVTRFGDLNHSCTAPGPDCHPLKLVGAFTGRYGSFLVSTKFGTSDPTDLPERDIYFCAGQVCAESDPGAMPSGWVGQHN